MFLVSPTEPAAIRALGRSTLLPEEYGVDVMFASKLGLVGVQRKELTDLVASIRDGRLGQELAQMQRLNVGIVLMEGDWQWTRDGESLRVRGMSRTQVRGLEFSLQSRGYWTLTSLDTEDTIECLSQLRRWCEKDSHSSLSTRPKVPAGAWGKRTNRDWGVYVLQSFPGVGAGMAERIYDHFNGVPLTWTTDVEGLQDVPGIGKKRARQMIGALEDDDNTTAPHGSQRTV